MSGGGSSVTRQTAEPWAEAAPYLKDILARSYRWYHTGIGSTPFPYSQVAGFTPQQQLAQSLGYQRGYYGSPVANIGSRMLTDTLGGQYLTAQSNPYLATYAQAAVEPIWDKFATGVVPALQTTAQQAGRYGSGAYSDLFANALGTTMQNIGNTLSGIYAPAYQLERAHQMAAAQQALPYAANEWQDIQNMINIGGMQQELAQRLLAEQAAMWNYLQQEPLHRLTQYANIIAPIAGQGRIGVQTVRSGGGLKG